MKKQLYILGTIPILLTLSLVFIGANMNIISYGVSVSDTVEFGRMVCVAKNGVMQGCTTHNVITTVGKNHIKEVVGQGASSAAVDYLEIGNGTAPAVGDTTLNSPWTACGLARAQGTYKSEGDGNWTIYYTWTSSCDNAVINTTALFNASSAGTMYAGTTITSMTLQTNDQGQVNYTTWVA